MLAAGTQNFQPAWRNTVQYSADTVVPGPGIVVLGQNRVVLGTTGTTGSTRWVQRTVEHAWHQVVGDFVWQRCKLPSKAEIPGKHGCQCHRG
jgi:hypothetical protein